MKYYLATATLLFSLLLGGCSTYQPAKAPCPENVGGKIKINQW